MGKTLQEVQEGTTSTEFLEWLKFMEMDQRAPEKSDYYGALIASTIWRTVAKNPKDVKLEDFLLDFKPIEEPVTVEPKRSPAPAETLPTPPKPLTASAARIEQSRMFWMSVAAAPKDPKTAKTKAKKE